MRSLLLAYLYEEMIGHIVSATFRAEYDQPDTKLHQAIQVHISPGSLYLTTLTNHQAPRISPSSPSSEISILNQPGHISVLASSTSAENDQPDTNLHPQVQISSALGPFNDSLERHALRGRRDGPRPRLHGAEVQRLLGGRAPDADLAMAGM